MAFTIAPAPNFNSYADVASFVTYHADRANAAVALLDADEIEPLLVKATDFINLSYVLVVEPVADGTVNPAIKTACLMLAGYALTTDLFGIRPDRDIVEEELEGDGVGKLRTKYSGRNNDCFPAVTALLSDVAQPYSSSVFIGRMVR